MIFFYFSILFFLSILCDHIACELLRAEEISRVHLVGRELRWKPSKGAIFRSNGI